MGQKFVSPPHKAYFFPPGLELNPCPCVIKKKLPILLESTVWQFRILFRGSFDSVAILFNCRVSWRW